MKFRIFILCLLTTLVFNGCSQDPEALKQQLLTLGDKYLDQERYEEASLLYQRALQQDPQFTAAYCHLAEAALKQQDIGAVVNASRRCFELDRSNLRAFSLLSDAYLGMLPGPGQPRDPLIQELITITEQAEAVSPGAFEVLLVKGLVLREQGDLKGATVQLRQALEQKSGDKRTALALADCLYRQGNEEEFEKLARESIASDPSFGQMYDLLYAYYYRKGQREEAAAILTAKADKNRSNSAYQIDLVSHYWREGQKDEAEKLLAERVLAKKADFPNAEEIVGDFYLQAGEGGLAISHYQQGRTDMPDAETAKRLTFKSVIALATENRWDEASTMVDKLIEQYPDDPDAIGLRASLRLQSGDQSQLPGAVQDLEGLIQKLPDNVMLRYSLGNAYLRSGDLRSAENQFKEALTRNPDLLLAKYGLISIHLARNELVQATVLAKEILDIYPNDPNAMLAQATAWIGLKKFDGARKDLEDLAQRGLLASDVAFQQARLDVATGQLGSAESQLLKMTAQSPDDDRGWRGLSALYRATGRTDQVRKVLEDRVARSPERVDYRFDLALFTARLGNTDEAIDELKNILAESPKYDAAHIVLGELLSNAGDEEGAKSEYIAAAQVENPSAAALLKMGTLLAQEGQYKEARTYLERTLQISPDQPVANNNLAFVLLSTDGDLDVALNHARRAVAQAPGNPEFADTLAQVNLKRGTNAEAARVLEPVVKANPERVDFRIHYAQALLGQGETETALKELETALNGAPDKEQQGQIRTLMAEAGAPSGGQ